MKKVAVILNGCGHRDGSEIHEATIALLAIEQAGAQVSCFAPNKEQAQVINHLTGKKSDGSRNMLEESARIARGKISDLSTFDANLFDALVIPGGFGAAYNLCNFAEKGSAMEVLPEVTRAVSSMHELKKPIGAICIAPVILAKVLGKFSPELTLGAGGDEAQAITKLGARHVECKVTDCVVDRNNLIVTTPAYMLANGIKDLYEGISKLAKEVIALAKHK